MKTKTVKSNVKKVEIKRTTDYIVFDILDEGDGPFVGNLDSSSDKSFVKNYQYYIEVAIPTRGVSKKPTCVGSVELA